jgi:hypothetical protein
MWNPFKKKKIVEEMHYPVYLRSNNGIHYIIIYSEKEGYHFSLHSQMQGSIEQCRVGIPLITQYTNPVLYSTIIEDEFIDALDECKYIPKKEKLHIIIKK